MNKKKDKPDISGAGNKKPSIVDPFLHMDTGLAQAMESIKKTREGVKHREMGMALDSLGDALEEARRWCKVAADVNQGQKLGVAL